MSRLKEKYTNEIVDAMTKKFGYKNIMEVPKLDKIVINMGVGEAKDNAKVLESAVKDMETITGQKAVLTRAKNSVANFKIREGMAIGCKVTLRGEKIGHNDVKIAAVVAHIENGPILRHMLLADDGKLYAGHEKNQLKGSLHQAERAVILGALIEFSDDPLDEQHRDSQNQKAE